MPTTWVIIFRTNAQPTNLLGAPMKSVSMKNVARARTEPGWLILENAQGETVYAVPSEVISYAGDAQHETDLAKVLRDAMPQGQA